MSRVVSREQFMEVCPPDLKKRIEDFFIYFSEKKKSSTFLNPNDNKSGEHSHSNKFQKKKQSNVNFKKPFDKSLTDAEKVLVNYRGIVSKLNETNQDAIWKELLELQLEKFISNPDIKLEEDTKTHTKIKSDEKNYQKEIAMILYQNTKISNMYLREYIDLVNKIKKNKDLSPFALEFIQIVFDDLNAPRLDDKEYNILTHRIFAELTKVGLITKKKFINIGLINIHLNIIKNLEECENNEELLTILISNFKSIGHLINKDKDVVKIIEAMKQWKTSKTFSGKLHFNLIDILNEVEKW